MKARDGVYPELTNPHPVACAFVARFFEWKIKDQMRLSFERIRSLKEKRNETSKKLFSRMKFLEFLDKEEEKHCKSLQLGRCLWQLERIMVESHYTRTMSEVYESAIEKLLLQNSRLDEPVDDKDKRLLVMLKTEKLENNSQHSMSLVRQKTKSKEIKDFLLLLTTTGGDDDENEQDGSWWWESIRSNNSNPMTKFITKHYLPCRECAMICARRSLKPFGRFGMIEGDKHSAFTCRQCADSGGVSKQNDEESFGNNGPVSNNPASSSSSPTNALTTDNGLRAQTEQKKNKRYQKKKNKKQKGPQPRPLPSSLPRPETDLETEIKDLMDAYCAQIRFLKEERDKACKKLFSKNTTKTTQKMHIQTLEVLDKEEEKQRNGFGLARCLLQLEGVMNESCYYDAWTKNERVTAEAYSSSTKNEESSTVVPENLPLIEGNEHQGRYRECLAKHKELSEEIMTYMTGFHESCKLTDEVMLEFTLDHYEPCMRCNLFHNRKSRESFGRVLAEDDMFVCRGCDHLIEDCYRADKDKELVRGENSVTTERTELANTEHKGTTKRKRRKRKKKKKKKGPRSHHLPSSSSSQAIEIREAAQNRSRSLHDKAPPLQETNHALPVHIKEPKSESCGVSICQSCCPIDTCTITPTTSCSSSATHEFLERTSQEEEEEREKEEFERNSLVVDDLNEVLVKYLWETGSIIALNNYMNEMEKKHDETPLSSACLPE